MELTSLLGTPVQFNVIEYKRPTVNYSLIIIFNFLGETYVWLLREMFSFGGILEKNFSIKYNPIKYCTQILYLHLVECTFFEYIHFLLHNTSTFFREIFLYIYLFYLKELFTPLHFKDYSLTLKSYIHLIKYGTLLKTRQTAYKVVRI